MATLIISRVLPKTRNLTSSFSALSFLRQLSAPALPPLRSLSTSSLDDRLPDFIPSSLDRRSIASLLRDAVIATASYDKKNDALTGVNSSYFINLLRHGVVSSSRDDKIMILRFLDSLIDSRDDDHMFSEIVADIFFNDHSWRHVPPGPEIIFLEDDSSFLTKRPPEGTDVPPGCDFEHWLVLVDHPRGDPSRDEIIDSYIKILAQVVGSEEEARMKIYSVSTRYVFSFGALVSEELADKIRELPRVLNVIADDYVNVEEKDYGGEPFINGQAVPYDPKYHEVCVGKSDGAPHPILVYR
ncbi:uncharacterized protein LOC130724121 [Lotus japonicus]|uniref:uncharacterized protein LOC130724121 n=1 Tax=Lotus japonicus TaxID=34305 RepID=UPI00258C61C1|nr:uncharacterized protein LOC130724121 [Lotus japonicus]